MVVHAHQPRVVARHGPFQKHLQTFPIARPGPGRSKIREPLPDPRVLDHQTGAKHPQVLADSLKHTPRTKRSDHFVVAQIQNHQIRFVLGTFRGDVAHDMRIDRSEGKVVYFKLLIGTGFGQHHVKKTAKMKIRARDPLRGRAAEHKNPVGPRWLLPWKINPIRVPWWDRLAEVTVGKAWICGQMLIGRGRKKGPRVTVSGNGENEFGRHKYKPQEQTHSHCGV